MMLLMIIGSWTSVWGYGETKSYVYQNAGEKSASDWGNIIWTDANSAEVSFWATKNMGTAVGDLRVDAYINGSWTEILSIKVGDLEKNKYKPFSIDVTGRNVSGLRFTNEGSYTRKIKDIKVTRATNITATTASLAFDSQSIGTSTTKTASFSFNNTYYNQRVTGSCTNSLFTVSPVDVGATGSSSVNVTYSSTAPGVHSGIVTLRMNGATTTFEVSGSTTATYNFSATANPNNTAFGTATATVDASVTSTNTSETTTATFTATANSDYEFVGWGTTQDATSYESTANPYKPTITNFKPGSTANKTLYAIFKPVFKFTATAEKINGNHGNVSATVTDKILGDPTATSLSTQATFTATPAEDCTFEGWYYDAAHTNLASKDATFTPTITNETVGSTKNLTLYAWFKKNQTLTWNKPITDFILVTGNTADCSATATSGLPVSYDSSNKNTAEVDAYGVVTAKTASNDKVTITASQGGNDEYNAAPSITCSFNVQDKLQATFKINGEAGFTAENSKLKVGQSTTITASNIDEGFTCTSSSQNVVSVSRQGNIITLQALQAGTSTVELSQPANSTHYASSAKYVVSVERHQGGLAITIPSTMQVGDTKNNFYTTSNDEVAVSVTSSNTNAVQYANGILTAVGEGTATITVSQAETTKWAGESRKQTITVSKVTNTLGVTLAALEAQVDGTIAVTFSNRNNTDTPIEASITGQLSSKVNNGTDVISYANGVITAKNAGKAKITFRQSPSYKYTGYTSVTYEVSVTKISNTITIKLDGEQKISKNAGYNQAISVAYVSPSDAPYKVNLTSGSEAIAVLSGDTITTKSTDGSNIWKVTQAETYKYSAGEANFRIKVNSITEGEGYVYEGWCDGSQKEWDTRGGTGALALNGPGEFFTFQAKRTSILWVSNSSNFYAEYSTDGGNNWSKVLTLNLPNEEEWYDFSCEIPENATHIRILTETGATGNKQVRNVRVSRKTYVRTIPSKTDMGTVLTDNSATATISIDYSSINGGKIEVISNNKNFTVSPSDISVQNNSDNRNNPATVTVTYTPDPSKLGAEEATISIGDLFYSNDITFTATAEKRANTLSVIGNQSLKVGNVVKDIYTGRNSDADIEATLSNEGIIKYDKTTNTATAIGEGTTTLTFTQNTNDLYEAATKTVTFNVSKNDNTLSISLDKTSLKVEETARVTYSDKNSDGKITATYSTENIISYEDGVMKALHAGTTRMTLTQASTAAYKEFSQSFDITVTKHDQNLKWTKILTEEQYVLNVGQSLDTNTATASSNLTVTYHSGNPAIIEVDPTTGKITALADGADIAVTATQAGNYKYNAASITRYFTVISKRYATVTTSLSDTEANPLTLGEDPVTIECNATLTESNFTITDNGNGYIETSFADNILTIKPVKVGGEVTIMLTRDEDDRYNALSKTFRIQVQGPALTLSQDAKPDVRFPGTVYREVTLSRTLPAGLSTIALPFNTTMTAIAGEGYDPDENWIAQLSVATYNSHDGWSLYFEKIETGNLQANQPYILHLGQETTPPVFQQVTVETPDPAERSATGGASGYEDWKMVANYEPHLDMEGKYGVVNTESCLKLGAQGSYLNAFTAYITSEAVQPAQTRTHFVTQEELTGILSPDEELRRTEVYDLQGRRLSKAGHGIHLIRREDGTIRKILK